jgi:lipopolysaccharide export system permease protein
MLTRIDLYILKQVLTPLFATLGVAALLLLLERMLRLFDIVANQGGPVGVVFKMLGNLIPHYLGMALPIGIFLGILLAFRKLSSNSELESLQATGLGLPRLMRAPMILCIVLCAFSVGLLGYIQPTSYYAFQNLQFELSSGAFGASIKPGEYNDLGDGLTLRIAASDDGGKKLTGIFAQKERPNGHVTTITAREGQFLATTNGSIVLLRLQDGILLDDRTDGSTTRTFRFQQHDWQIELPEIEQFRDRGGKEKEMTLHELILQPDGTLTSFDDTPAWGAFLDRTIRSLSILMLPFLAIGLGVVSKRQQRSLGMVVGLVLLLTLHKMVEFSLASSNLGAASGLASMIIPFLVFSFLSIFFFHTTAVRVGASPLAWLELVIDKITKFANRFAFDRTDPSAPEAGAAE